MWYEILPSAAIVFAALMIPPYASGAINYFVQNGKFTGRFWENHQQDFNLYLRDRRLTGSEFVPRGLEGIPDAKN